MADFTENQLKWKAHIDAATKAGETLADYARAHDLDLKKLYSYSRVIRQRQQPAAKPGFVRVQSALSAAGVRIELANGVRVHLAAAPPDLGGLLMQLAKLP